MPRVIMLSLLLCMFVTTLTAQSDVIYYRFDTGTGNKVINLVPPTSPAPLKGTISSTYPGSLMWARGIVGPGALYGSHFDAMNPTVRNPAYHTYVDTGWSGAFTGSFTIAWFMKERSVIPAVGQCAYLFSGVGSFRLFLGGVAYRGIYLRAWGGSPSDLILRDPQYATTTEPSFNLQGAAEKRWVHVAIVVDAKAMKATWFIDGKPLTPSITITVAANVAASTNNLRVGMHSSATSAFAHDLDDFRFCTRAATAKEIQLWANMRSGEAYSYGKACNGSALSAASGPALGKPFLMDLTGPKGSAGLFSLGYSRTKMGPLTLPFDLGLVLPGMNGCNWESNMTLVLPIGIGSTGATKVGIPIPLDPLFMGAEFYSQVLLATPANQVALSNGLALLIGN